MAARKTMDAIHPNSPVGATMEALPAKTTMQNTFCQMKVERNPLSASSRSVSPPALAPTERATFVVPILPDPTFLTSIWPSFEAMRRPNGMPQTK
jgi:hypothetical protein